MIDERSAVGQVVKHTVFGMGIVCSESDERIIVDFGDYKKKFIFPDVFEKFLEATNEDFAQYVNELIMKRKPKGQKKVAKKNREILENEVDDETDDSVDGEYDEVEEDKVVDEGVEDEGYNIAFNCNFCDGGKSRKQIGYNGICSSGVIEDNIRVKKRFWCSDNNCPCCRFLNGEINRVQLESILSDGGYICYESELLSNWKKFDGYYINGKSHEMSCDLNKVKNSLCILTTVDSKDDEKNRYVFALFLIEHNEEENDFVKVKSKYKIKVSPKQARSLLFWELSNLPQNDLWNKDNFTYFGNKMAANILREVSQIKKGTKDEKLAWEMYDYFCKSNDVEMV